jgi:hypothetical protein
MVTDEPLPVRLLQRLQVVRLIRAWIKGELGGEDQGMDRFAQRARQRKLQLGMAAPGFCSGPVRGLSTVGHPSQMNDQGGSGKMVLHQDPAGLPFFRERVQIHRGETLPEHLSAHHADGQS